MSVAISSPTLVIRPSELPTRIRDDPARRAEVKFFDALRLQVGPGWVVFYSVAWLAPRRGRAPEDGETDFIVAHPAKGILLIEVKGGRIRYDEQRRQWISRDGSGIDHDIDPFQQVRRSKYALLNKLKALSVLRGLDWIELSHAVAFPDSERPRHAITPDAPPEIIIGQDDLHRLPARIEEILRYAEPGTQRQFQHGQRIVPALIHLLGQTTELRNPLALKTAEEDREIVRLTEEQFRTLDMLSRIPRAAIGGCAGAGKTFLAVEKAKRLAREEFRTLLTCYNRPLADCLKQATAGTANLEVMTFHQLCHSVAHAAGIPQTQLEDYPSALSEAIRLLPDRKYDAIVVDEGQDFKDTWWIALEDCLQAANQSVLYVFYDNHQALYRGRGSLPGDLADIVLTENVRNTRAICDLLLYHYQQDQPIRPRGPVGRTVETQTYESATDLKHLLVKTLQRLLVAEGFSNSDLIVLTPRALDRSALLQLQFPGSLKLVTEEPRSGSQEVLCSTVHRFKGLERRVAIVAELDDDLPSNISERAMLCYVAFSRPRTHLIVLGTSRVIPALVPQPR